MVQVLKKNLFTVTFICPRCGKLTKSRPDTSNTGPFSWSTAGVTCRECGHRDQIKAQLRI